MQKIYRLEHPSEKSRTNPAMPRGIYASGLVGLLIGELGSTETSPAPSEDVRLRRFWADLAKQTDWYFGFETIESLKRWFYDESTLDAYGHLYVLSVYEVPNGYCRIGTAQAIFNHRHIVNRTVLDNSILWRNNNE